MSAMDGSGPRVSSSSGGQTTVTRTGPAWSYHEEKDEFEGRVSKFCTTYSNDRIKAAFGTEKVMLQLRKRGKNNIDVIIHSDGVVFGHPEGSNKVRLKFDDESPFNVGFDGSADSSADTIFLRSSSKIIGKLKTSKKLIIELPVFMESGQRATFDIEGYSEICKFE